MLNWPDFIDCEIRAYSGWGARGPEFKSRRPDQYLRESPKTAVSTFVSTFKIMWREGATDQFMVGWKQARVV